MGLDASVRCNCIKNGIAAPHPFPDLLRLDETSEPILKGADEMPLDIWLEHDLWFRRSCSHGGYLLQERLGNASLVGHIRSVMSAIPHDPYPVLQERVIHSGVHAGDFIRAEVSVRLLEEAQRLRQLSNDAILQQFAADLIELAETSVATGNPIVF
jgi:hypothetical protein